jgi:epoxyqueuosine reductase
MASNEGKSRIRSLALAAGFDVVGFTSPQLPQTVSDGLLQFLALGHHGEMGWMETHAQVRAAPALIWPDAKTVIVLGQNYSPAENPMQLLEHKQKGIISAYAQGDDYHDVIKKKLKALAYSIARELGGDARVYVDTAPVMEKPLAQQAGLGWQGKHTCIVSKEFGSWLFLGEIFTSLDITPDTPSEDTCGTCTRCLDICPTQAFTAARELDARKCISYLTIEHKTPIPHEFRKAIGNRIYGCDDCLAVCPWNKFAQTANESAYHPRETLKAPLLSELVMLDDTAFRDLFRKSPVKRIGRERFIRNVLMAIGNCSNSAMVQCIIPLLSDTSSLVRASCVWAISELVGSEEFTSLKHRYLPHETDFTVVEEWNRIAP